jgi:ergothioneine biosynthesis protein EgtB
MQTSKCLIEQFKKSREYSLELIKPLSSEDCQAQSMEDASPAKWHLAHTTWFYEVMVLKSFEPHFQLWNPQFAVLFNSYYNGIGDKHPRKSRGILTRPSLQEVIDWRENINARIETLLEQKSSDELLWLIQVGINHEQQHQELLLTDIQHLFYQNTLYPTYSLSKAFDLSNLIHTKWIEGESGLLEVGFNGKGFHFDNEAPSHTTLNQTHSLSDSLVSNNEWLSFIEDGGYENSKWWLDAGWSWVQAENIHAPLYWNKNKGGQYYRFSLSGNHPLERTLPVSNISYFEADAFARWASQNLDDLAGARLPTEFEWEAFAKSRPEFNASLFGQVWQWTSSNYSPYPGYQPWSGIAGEYNGKFMVNQMVLRGSSIFTTPGHSRTTYRNFFPTHARWQMTGLRLAKDGV